tara:strand:- start:4461 stop:6515 length:2055 start_codon:yes stop_codon:yes gene_type:complete
MNIVYAAQFRDSSGYAVAARGYLKALDAYLLEHPNAFNLKIYSSVINHSDKLLLEEVELIEKYEFTDNSDLQKTINQDYIFVWHMPPPMMSFADQRFNPSPNCSPSLQRLLQCSSKNVNLTVWETTTVPIEWRRDYEYYNPDKIIVPCKWNKEVFEKDVPNVECDLVPHIIEETTVTTNKSGYPLFQLRPLNLPINLTDKFVVLTMSQWTKRKGFDTLIKSFTAEFGNNKDAVLIVKTYGGPEGDAEHIGNYVKSLRNSVLLPGPVNTHASENNILLIPGFVPTESIMWLHQQATVFALFSRGEGFGLPIAEAIMAKKPVIVPKEGGHVDYIRKDSAFFVDGYWDTCAYGMTPYGCDGDWYECSIKSGREQLRKAYNIWKQKTNHLSVMGVKACNHILDGEYSRYRVGSTFFNSLKDLDTTVTEPKSIAEKRKIIKQKINKASTLKEKIDLLKDSFKGETCYILSCGPSISDYTLDEYKDKLQDKLVLAVKQTYNKVPDLVDFHFFNCANIPMPTGYPLLEHYKYDEDGPIVVASSNYPLHKRWSPYQKHDLFFKIPIRTEINDEFICKTKDFDNFDLATNIDRPCGPGIMYETVIFMAAHLGVKKIVAVGWDLSQTNPKKPNEYKHFYKDEKMLIKGDILPWEVAATCEASKELYEWLQSRGIELELASNKSSLYKKIPRVVL